MKLLYDLLRAHNDSLDVWDTEEDMCITFTLPDEKESLDFNDRFLLALSKRIVAEDVDQSGYTTRTNWSEFFRVNAEKLNAFAKKFELGPMLRKEDEAFTALWNDIFQKLVSGYAAERFYLDALHLVATLTPMEGAEYAWLPDVCYALSVVAGKPVILKKGEEGYYECKEEIPEGMTARDFMEAKNAELGVTKQEEQAMYHGSLCGYLTALSEPLCYDKNGKPLK